MSDAYKRGQSAYEFEVDPEDCPFGFETEEYADWMNGYFDSLEEEYPFLVEIYRK